MRRSLLIALLCPAPALALGQLLPTPDGSAMFGKEVTLLPNGNFVVTDPLWSGTEEEMGAVYLYGADGTLISRLTGSHSSDNVGSEGIVVLANGNFVVRSQFWDGPGGATDVGAVTFGNAQTGFGGDDVTVSAANSLVGDQPQSRVGKSGVFALSNGHYVVASRFWGTAAAAKVGAVTWGDGATGVSGIVSDANSLLGSHADDQVGSSITVLANDNYVVASPLWDSDTDADVGAVTLRLGDGPVPTKVAASNSLTGSSPNDRVGSGGVIALNNDNGNFAFASPLWDHAQASNAGAVTWHAGNGATSGAVDVGNSLVGVSAGDSVGSGGLVALDSGHYAIASPEWDRGLIAAAGAVTLTDGKQGSTGEIGIDNSVVGSTAFDRLGSDGLVAIGDGGVVALCPKWDDGNAIDAGAVFRIGGIAASRDALDGNAALRGKSPGDLEFARVEPLANGHYVVTARLAQIDNTVQAGAVAWCPGDANCAKVLGVDTALVGSREDDSVGAQRVLALPDGNYVVFSPFVDTATTFNAGAITWADGSTGIAGIVDADNSLLGRAADDIIGAGEGVALPDSSYAIFSPQWAGNAGVEQGAISFADAGQPLMGTVDESNSVYAPAAHDFLGFLPRTIVTADGRLLAAVPHANSGAGAIVIIDPAQEPGELDFDTGVRGGTAQGGVSMRFDWHEATQTLVVGDPAANRVWLAKLAPQTAAIFRDGFE